MCIFSRPQAAPPIPFQLLEAHCLGLLALGHAEVFTGGSQGHEGGHPGPRLKDSPPGPSFSCKPLRGKLSGMYPSHCFGLQTAYNCLEIQLKIFYSKSLTLWYSPRYCFSVHTQHAASWSTAQLKAEWQSAYFGVLFANTHRAEK